MEKRNIRGHIFDIRRFSTHDGAGIRTTIFLKGCPLRCVWCHNPEGISRERRPLYFSNTCIGCKICCSLAVNGGVRWDNGGLLLDAGKTEDWDGLIAACPTGALAWDSRLYSIEEVLREARKDEPFFRHGGGVTLSGGEPLLQPDFTAALLERLQACGIHTAIETSLYASPAVVQKILPWVDTLYVDLKLYDCGQHRQFTGVDNEGIKENIKLVLAAKPEAVIVRTPLIPGMTDSAENIAAISRYISQLYANVRYELLNYNPLGAAKYRLLGQPYCFAENPRRYSPEEMAAFVQIAEANGVRHVLQDS